MTEKPLPDYEELEKAIRRTAIPLYRLRLSWKLQRRLPKKLAWLLSRLCPKGFLPL